MRIFRIIKRWFVKPESIAFTEAEKESFKEIIQGFEDSEIIIKNSRYLTRIDENGTAWPVKKGSLDEYTYRDSIVREVKK